MTNTNTTTTSTDPLGTSISNNLFIQMSQIEYQQVSTCPHCGAPVYINANLGAGVLPVPFYTCTCRMTLHQPVSPWYPAVPPYPNYPFTPGPSWGPTGPGVIYCNNRNANLN